ncbi:MAG TPA: CHAD domain-containing protein, partial [Candidatus Limnocylindrales bacterium]|nr:CHAD domain-containing protein [Candidatus Limnocylindrales bacterium]
MTAPDLGAASATLQPDDTFRQAARAAMWPHVQRLLELEAQMRDPEATDDLKRYRVATRRLRAALRVFAQALPRRTARDVTPELRDLARAVGRVRDLDVRIDGLHEWATRRGTATVGHVEPLRARWVGERATAAAELEPRLTGKRHARLLDDLADLVTASRAHP